MTPRTTTKLTLALAGMLLFGAGIRYNINPLRWTGLALVAVAWVLRFQKDPSPSTHPQSSEPPES